MNLVEQLEKDEFQWTIYPVSNFEYFVICGQSVPAFLGLTESCPHRDGGRRRFERVTALQPHVTYDIVVYQKLWCRIHTKREIEIWRNDYPGR